MNKMNCQRKYLPRTYLIIQNHKEFLKFNNKETSNTVKKWAKSQTMTTPDAGGEVEQQELLFIAGRNAEC